MEGNEDRASKSGLVEGEADQNTNAVGETVEQEQDEHVFEEETVIIPPQSMKRKVRRDSRITPHRRTDKYSLLVEKETKRLIMLQPTAGQAVRFELVLGPTFFNLRCLPKAPHFTQREADRLDRLLTDDSGGLFPPKAM